MAGRRLEAPLIFATVLAANIGAGATVGATGLAYRDGLSAWWWNGSAAIGSLFLALFIGPRIWRIAKEHNLYTAGDYLEHRYGPAVRAVVTSLIWLGTLSILAGQLIAGAAVLSVVADVPRTTGVLLSAAVMTVYFVAGGLLGSAWINAIQLVVLIGGFLIALPMVLDRTGGLAGIVADPSVPAAFGDFWYSAGPGSGWLLIALVPAFVISPGLMQKAYGASSARSVTRGIGIQAVALALFAFIPVLFGMAARVATPGITDPNLVLPTVLESQLPVALGALGLAAVYSAEVSTCDALLFMLATSLSKDLYKRFYRPEASDTQVLRVARAAAVAGALGGVLFALWLPTVTGALRIFYSLLGVSLLVPVVGGLYTRAGSRAALASIAAGIATLLAVRFVGGARLAWLDPTLAGLALAAVAYVVTARATRQTA
ncbi:MAG TPA: sodium:solute symporter family protein [Gemmatimonadaceae bacterium]|nr:sodium:solute symporter family protein [Gemmatimonadaceae bacterium]